MEEISEEESAVIARLFRRKVLRNLVPHLHNNTALHSSRLLQ